MWEGVHLRMSMEGVGGDAVALKMCDMQAARQTLIERNRLLCAKHVAIGEQIAALARLDLVKQRTSWISGVEAVRRVFVRAESEFPRDLQVLFRLPVS